MTGLGGLLRLGLQTGWIGLIGWPVLIATLVAGTVAGIADLYPEAADRARYASTLGQSTASQAFNGRAYGVDTVGGIAAYEVGFMGQLLFPVAALALALRHTRREEEAGRLDVVTAGRVGRMSPLAAAGLLVLASALTAGVLTGLGGAGAGLDADGATWYAASVLGTLAFFAAAGLLLGQLVQSTRTGWALGIGLIAAAYLTRALVDGYQLDAVWVSPLGWFAEVRPFTGQPQAWPLVAYAVAAAALLLLAVLVRSRRDLGSGVLAPRPGPAHAAAYLNSPFGYAWRLTRGPVLGWAALAIGWGALFGALAREVSALTDANPGLLDAMGVDRGSDLVTVIGLLIAVAAAAAAAVQAFGRLGKEESSERLGWLLGTRISRSRLGFGWLLVAGGSALAVLTAGAMALGLGARISTGQSGELARVLQAAAGYAVPVLLVGVLAAALWAVHPRWVTLAWLPVAWIAVVGLLGEALRLPGWAKALSVTHLVGDLPVEPLVRPALLTEAGVLVLLLMSGAWVHRRRDLQPG